MAISTINHSDSATIEQTMPVMAKPRPLLDPLGSQCLREVTPRQRPTMPVAIPMYQITSEIMPRTIEAIAGPWFGAARLAVAAGVVRYPDGTVAATWTTWI